MNVRWIGALILLVLAPGGCDRVFSVPLPSTDASSGIDSSTDGSTATCTMPLASSDFDVATTEPCEGFGSSNGVATMTIADGLLSIQYPSIETGNAGASCTAESVPFHDDGVFLEVVKIFDAPATSVFFQTFWIDAEGGMQLATFSASTDSVELVIGNTSSGRVPFDDRSKWWRLRPDRTLDKVVGEVSRDGSIWTSFGEGGSGVAAAVKVVFGGAIDASAAATAGVAQFESVNVCP